MKQLVKIGLGYLGVIFMTGCEAIEYQRSSPVAQCDSTTMVVAITPPPANTPSPKDTLVQMPKDSVLVPQEPKKDTTKVPLPPNTAPPVPVPAPVSVPVPVPAAPVPAPAPLPNTICTVLDDFWKKNAAKYDNNVVVAIFNLDSMVYSYKQGKYTADQPLYIASATKWLTGAVIMSLVDDKKLNLTDKVSKYVPSFAKYGKENITIKQLFAHTSGLIADSPFDERGGMTLQESVDSIAIYTKLSFLPGTKSMYGSCSYKVAARVAEVIESKNWQQIFDERIANKCGMKNVVFSPNNIKNPHPGAGVVCSFNEYLKFLMMMNNYGIYKNNRVLSQASIKEIESDQSGGINSFYGLGVWRYNVENGFAKEVSSPSAMGVHPWINREKKYFGLIFTQAGYENTIESNLAFRNLVQNQIR